MKIANGCRIDINRGDELLFDYQVLNGHVPYTFAENDSIGFYVYNKGQLDKSPVIEEVFKPEEGTNVIEIKIPADTMDIGTIKNIQQEYWYEITLNGDITLGYDDKGPKVLMLYPKGKK